MWWIKIRFRQFKYIYGLHKIKCLKLTSLYSLNIYSTHSSQKLQKDVLLNHLWHHTNIHLYNLYNYYFVCVVQGGRRPSALYWPATTAVNTQSSSFKVVRLPFHTASAVRMQSRSSARPLHFHTGSVCSARLNSVFCTEWANSNLILNTIGLDLLLE